MTDRLPISIDITPEAADYIREKGGAVMLRSTLKHGCCGGRVELVKAEAGKPRPEDDFERFDIAGITLYAERGLADELHQPIRIGLDRLFKLRSLNVQGAPAQM